MNQHQLVVISAPSGGGKNAIIAELLKRIPNSSHLVTTTTRAMREGERNGVDYYFITREQFEERLEKGAFLEHNEYAGNLYGTERMELERQLKHFDVVFSLVEVNGKKSFDRLHIPHISIFLLPESINILKDRLEQRGGMDPKDIAERLRIAQEELDFASAYDVTVVNKEGYMQETVEHIAEFLTKRFGNTSSVV